MGAGQKNRGQKDGIFIKSFYNNANYFIHKCKLLKVTPWFIPFIKEFHSPTLWNWVTLRMPCIYTNAYQGCHLIWPETEVKREMFLVIFYIFSYSSFSLTDGLNCTLLSCSLFCIIRLSFWLLSFRFHVRINLVCMISHLKQSYKKHSRRVYLKHERVPFTLQNK